ncbi:hypothetical protein AAD001_16355 [Colwelliaceae bacterium 6471]
MKRIIIINFLIVLSISFSVNAENIGERLFGNNPVWHQIDGGKTANLNAGDTIIIKRAALVSFLLKKTGSNRTVPVKDIK